MKCGLTELLAPLLVLQGCFSLASTNDVVLSVIVGDGYVLEELDTGFETNAVWQSDIVMDENGIVTISGGAASVSLPKLPGPESETNRVAVAILESTILSAVDNFDQVNDEGIAYTTQEIRPTWTWNGFLGEDETNGLTRAAKKACFDWYLNFIATNTCALTAEQTNLAMVAVSQCSDLTYTNAWRSLVGMTRNPLLPLRDQAGVMAMTFTPNSDILLSLGMEAYKNSIQLSVADRAWIVDAFADRLSLLDDMRSARVVNRIFLDRANECQAAMAFDRLFVSRVPGYEYSSNRLETARAILRNPDSWDFQNDYFADVTNRLLNAARPLVEVEALQDL